MTPTSYELLRAQKEADIIKRRERMDRTVKAHLASRGVTSADLVVSGTGRKMNVTNARDAILGWTWTVTLKSGDVLVYTMDNEDGAEIRFGDDVLELVDPTPASEE